MLTMVTEVFGVRGEMGELVIKPKLLKEQFDEAGKASIKFIFADKEFEVIYSNPKELTYGEYGIKNVIFDGLAVNVEDETKVVLGRETIYEMDNSVHVIDVELG